MQRNNAARALRSDYSRSWQDAASRVLEEGGGDGGLLLPRRSTDSAPGTQTSAGAMLSTMQTRNHNAFSPTFSDCFLKLWLTGFML